MWLPVLDSTRSPPSERIRLALRCTSDHEAVMWKRKFSSEAAVATMCSSEAGVSAASLRASTLPEPKHFPHEPFWGKAKGPPEPVPWHAGQCIPWYASLMLSPEMLAWVGVPLRWPPSS